ncbi:AAA family ATPase [Nocardia sp. NPDC057663]|uniref:AAA family ATPase n=1 Tax=Nocardia sp. NPDC057663 TaxID=3346201 RepID=UPI00366CD3DC
MFIESFEEQRVLDEIDAAVGSLKNPRGLWHWSATEGLRRAGGAPERETHAPVAMLRAIARTQERAVFVLSDLHAFLGGNTQPADPQTVRALRDVVRDFRSGELARTIIVVAPVLQIPPELEKDVTVVDFPLPDAAEIRALLAGMIARNGDSVSVRLDDRGRDRLTRAALGMTLAEAENAFSLAMVTGTSLTEADVDVVLAEKAQTIRKSGLLELVPTEVALDDVGGLDALKTWLDKRRDSWLAEAAAYGLPAPKGLLITGVPGCGKSLTAKAAAAAWGIPLIRLDIGRVFAGLVGASEHNMRTALATAEACAPCVLWVDEIDKGFAGAGTASDTGTSARVFGSFLAWLQEKTVPVFVMATANRIENLPPEFLRKGRFDEIFFVDLPDFAERIEIWRLHLARRPGPATGQEHTPELLWELARISAGFSGAEIEQAVVSGLFEAYFDRRALTARDLQHAVESTVPLSIVHAARVNELREWAKLRTVPASKTAGGEGRIPE